MNEENVQYLKDNLKYLGFGEKLNETLEKNIRDQQPVFSLNVQTEFNKKTMEAELHFRKSDTTDMYFFNRYDAKLKNSEDASKDLQQTFYVNKGTGITLKESFNLLEGRAVHKTLLDKEGEKYKAWVQLDLHEKDDKGNFKRQQYNEKYGYDVEKALLKYPIKETLDAKQKEDLIGSIQKGNVQVVNFVKEGKEEKMFIAADPKNRDFVVFDSKMQQLSKEDKVKFESVGKNVASKTAQDNMDADKKKDLTREGKPEKQRLDNKEAGKENDRSLLPKKRESTNRGMGL